MLESVILAATLATSIRVKSGTPQTARAWVAARADRYETHFDQALVVDAGKRVAKVRFRCVTAGCEFPPARSTRRGQPGRSERLRRRGQERQRVDQADRLDGHAGNGYRRSPAGASCQRRSGTLCPQRALRAARRKRDVGARSINTTCTHDFGLEGTMATTKEQNDRLTHVGPATPMGDLLRRYWIPVGNVGRAGGESGPPRARAGRRPHALQVRAGEYGLLGDRCPHRCMHMKFGVPDPRGLRCGYHAWLYDAQGNCLEQPWEDRTQPELRFRDKIKIKAYPVQELGGLVFAYLGPQPVPLLPRWDLLVRDDVDRSIDIQPDPVQLAAMHGQLVRSAALRVSARRLR